MKNHLIMTVDYEVFGNGTGNLVNCMLKPAEKIIAIANNFGAPITFFVDVLELIRMENFGLQDVEDVKSQIVNMILEGHDVQLHLHPQWENAIITSANTWKIDFSSWRIGDLSYEKIYHLLKISKLWLENLVKAFAPDYHCTVFRAGAWAIQPSHHVLRALMELGFLIDSSVAYGLSNNAETDWYNFTKAPDMPYWVTKNDVCSTSQDGILEIPIISGKVNPVSHFAALTKARLTSDRGFAKGCSGNYKKPYKFKDSLSKKYFRITRLDLTLLDFSVLPANLLIQVSQSWISKFGNDRQIPMVAISHTKNFSHTSEGNLEKYLEWASAEGITFSTFGKWLDEKNG